MKKINLLLISFFQLIMFSCIAQSDSTTFPEPDKSPMDMCYFPSNFPILKISDKVSGQPLARVIYGRPQKNGRTIFGDLVEYGKVWRLGANEATEIELFRDAVIGGKPVKKGRYSLYAIPRQDSWTLIVNKETDTWGAFKYDPANDIVRVDRPVNLLSSPLEILSMTFTKNDSSTSLVMAWDNILVKLPILFK